VSRGTCQPAPSFPRHAPIPKARRLCPSDCRQGQKIWLPAASVPKSAIVLAEKQNHTRDALAEAEVSPEIKALFARRVRLTAWPQLHLTLQATGSGRPILLPK
jgi:hypothetical protein